MRRGKRWSLVSEDEAEELRSRRPNSRARLLRAAAVSFMMSGPLVACNQKGGWDEDSGKVDTGPDTSADTDTDDGIDTDPVSPQDTSLSVETDTPEGSECVVQPDCCAPLGCIWLGPDDSDIETCDTDCDRAMYSCEVDEAGTCTLVEPADTDTDGDTDTGGSSPVPLPPLLHYCEFP